MVQDRNAPQKHVWRAEIVLLTADASARTRSCGDGQVQDLRLALAGALSGGGFDRLLRDKTRPSRIKPLGVVTTERVVALTLGDPPGETTHWTGALMAKASGLSVSSL